MTGQPQREDLGSESWIGEGIRGVEDIGANRVKELERRGKRKGWREVFGLYLTAGTLKRNTIHQW